MRINKYIANCGVTSRRKADILVSEGRVKVNGVVVAEPGEQVDPEKDVVTIDGKSIGMESEKVYILLNKPVGYVSTAKDQFDRKSVTDLVNVTYRIYPVGRLDYDTSGLLVLTNDGEFTYKVTHPKHEIVKTYIAKVNGVPNGEEMKKFEEGLDIGGFITSRARIRIVSQDKQGRFSTLEIKIHEGKNRQVRRMCEEIGHEVITLERISIGSLKMGNLKKGNWRYLSKEEVKGLLNHKNNR